MHHPDSLHWQSFSIGREARAALKLQRPMVLWFTGLSGSGKSTIANILEQRLSLRGRHTFILDGDNLRHGLNRDLGFTVEHRCENIRRTAEVAMLMTEAGLIVLVCLISPFRSERQLARNLMRDGDFIEIFVDTPLGICAERDPKGLYRKAFSGEIANFTGVSSPYEAPERPDIHLVTDGRSPFELASQVEQYLDERHLSPPYQLRQA